MNPNIAEQDEQRKRLDYIISRLIEENDFVRIETLADEMYVSRATIDRMMPQLRGDLERYKLVIETKPRYGIRVSGSEVNMRVCYARHGGKATLMPGAERTALVQKILLEETKKAGIVLNDNAFYNLVYHCLIAIRRIQNGNTVFFAEDTTLRENAANELEAAQNIVIAFEKAFQITIPEIETGYIAMHLLGKRTLVSNNHISPKVWRCVDEILQEINTRQGINLSSDFELKSMLALHLQPMFYRLQFGLKQSNPILEDVKRDLWGGYELATCAADVVEQNYGQPLDENEIGYLAIHFAFGLEKKQKNRQRKRIAVICATGRGTAKLVQYRLMTRYGLKEKDIFLASVFQLEKITAEEFSCVLTTVPILQELPVPIIDIEPTMSAEASAQLDHMLLHGQPATQGIASIVEKRMIFPAAPVGSRDEALCYLCEKLSSAYGLNAAFTAAVRKREALSSTEVGSMVALPHPYEYGGDRILLAFLTGKKAFRWKNGMVRLVILAAFPKQNTELSKRVNDCIARFLCDEDKINRVIRNLCREEILGTIFEVEQP